MRNLKRALSLTLASVMLLGMMVVGSSAAAGYSDVDENDNVEAIEVLQAVEVMVGDDRGFGPDRPVTRNEMAVVMGKLLNLNYNYYVSTCPFTDVADWAKGWVGACYANGIVSGRGNGIYDGEATVTAVEAASMMMRALGYFKYTEDYADGFNVVTVRQGSEIGIFNDVGTDAATPMTRNQVAQMALNALKANMVTFTGTPGIEVNGVKVGYKAEYTARTSPDRKYAAIGKLVSNIGTTDQYYIQLGEELYDGDLRLNDDSTDDFGRPARYWEYDGTAIGTYAKKELLDESYTEKVTGKMLYDLLGKDLVNLIDGSDRNTRYTLTVTIDGNDDNATQTKVFGKSALSRTNTDGVGGTGNGVLTEVYVDNTARTIDIAIINTYLAIADNDYNEKKDEVSLNIYNLDKSGSLYFKDYKRDGDGDDWRDAENVLKANGEDFNIVDVKKDDKFLVTVAKGELKSVVAPEILTEQTITSHKTHDYVVADKQYDYTTTAQYDVEVMESFGSADMKEVTYDIVLDKYGYLIGVEQNEKVDQYVFVTGIDDAYSYLSKKNVPANVIFLDGTMKTVTMNTDKSSDFGTRLSIAADEFAQVNTWCTYSVDKDDIYTLTMVDGAISSGVKVAQMGMDANTTAQGNASSQIKINSKNISLYGTADGTGSYGRVHGNDNTVYINAEMDNVEVSSGDYRRIVKDVDSITTGVTNVDMTVSDIGTVSGGDKVVTENGHDYIAAPDEVYTLYNDKGTIIAVVTLEAVDEATTKHYAYINSGDIDHRDYNADTKEYSWYRQAIVDGEFVMLKEVDDNTASQFLKKTDLAKGAWYEIKYNADGEVRGTDAVTYPANQGDVPSFSLLEVGTHYMQDCNMIADAKEKTFILNADLTATKPELKYSAGTLYTGNDATKGVYVSSSAKVVVYTKDYDKHEEFTGAEMEKALNALVNKKAFDGIINAVIGSDGVATVVILDEKNMDRPDTYSVTFGGDAANVTINPTPISGLNKGENASFTVTAKNGYVLDSVKIGATALTPDANGKYTIYNITENVIVTIATTRDTNAYAGEVVFDVPTTGASRTVTAEWTGSAQPTEDELFSLLIDELVKMGYSRSDMKNTSQAGTDVEIEVTPTINGVPGNKVTFTLTITSGLTQVEEIATSDALAAKITANSTTKVKLTGNATVASAPTMDIEVESGKTLTLSGNVVLSKAITGAGSVAFGGNVTDGAEKIAVTGGISVDTGKTLTVDAAWTIPSDITGAGKVTATAAVTNGDKIKVTTGGLTLGASSSIDKINNTVDVTVSGNTEIKGVATPKSLTWSSGDITVTASTGNLTLPDATLTMGGKLILNGTVTLGHDVATTNTAAVIAIGATGDLKLNGKALTGGGTTATITVADGGKITGSANTNFYASNTKLTADVVASGAAKTCTWSTTADGATATGWVVT